MTTRIPAELFDCDRVNSYLDSYLLDQVPPPERRGMRLHIHGCAACFEKVMARDPMQLLAPLADQAPPERTWDGFWPAIAEGIRESEARSARRVVWVRAAALLVAAVALTVGLMLVPRVGPRGPRQTVAVPEPIASAGAGLPPGFSGPLPQTVEQVRTVGSREVQVYTMSYTQALPAGAAAKGAETPPAAPAPVAELVLIVDKGLEL